MLLKNCRLIPELSDGKGFANANVFIEKGKIAAIRETEWVGQGHEVIDCQGKTLLPGLIDLHTHISGLRFTEPNDLKRPMHLLIKCCKVAQRYLDYGYTTIRDAGSQARVANSVRAAIEEGICVGPRLIACGLIITPTEIEEADSIFDMYAEADGKDAMLRAARKELAEHADYVKLMASGSAFHKQGIPTQPIITLEELSTAVDAAAMKSTYVAAHAHSAAAIKLCIEAGVRTIEHASYIDEDGIRMMLDRKDVFLVPTLAAMYQDQKSTIGTPYEYLIPRLREMLLTTTGNIERAYRAGLKLGFGTDSTVGMHQYENGIEFKFRSELCHMTAIDILLQATKYNAEILGLFNVIGEIKEGLEADLILVDGRPDEDISVMYRKPDMVFLNGARVWKSSSLRTANQ